MTVRLTRTIRFCINDPIQDLYDPKSDQGDSVTNSYAAFPTLRGFGRYYEFDVCCCGDPDPATGYFLNIKTIDAAVRAQVIPKLTTVITREPTREPVALLPELLEALNAALSGTVASITWHLTPTFSMTLEADQMSHCIYRQRFAFASSHRLHCPNLSSEENQRIFGKCNNVNGHGHNYQLEVAAECPTTHEATAAHFDLQRFEALVQQTIVERFDHRNLNLDCAEFSTVNPTVENISRISYELLEPILHEEGIKLKEVTIWETEKTRCSYPG